MEGSKPFVRLVKTLDTTDSAYVLTVAEIREVPLHTLLLLDEAAHHLRSALDQMVFALSLADSGKAHSSTQFPLRQDPDDWDKDPNGKHTQSDWLRGVSKPHRDAIERHQPYHPFFVDGVPHPHPLRTVSELDNDNKHRVIQPSFPIAHKIKVEILTRGSDCELDLNRISTDSFNSHIAGRPLKVGSEVARVPVTVTGPDPDLKLHIHFAWYIGFRNGIGCRSLLTAADYVSAVLKEFAPALETPASTALWRADEGRFKEASDVEIIRTVRQVPLPDGTADLSPLGEWINV